jgi:signal peptidase I
MNDAPSVTDQIANVSPLVIVGILVFFTLVRLVLAKNQATWARTLSDTCDTVNFVLTLAFLLIRPFVAQAFYIPSESMERTLLVGDRLIADKISLRFREPQRGDILVFAAPPEATGGADQDYIKRCIATPGQTIEVKGAKMTIDGESVDYGQPSVHAYLRSRLGLPEMTPVKIFSDHILVDGTKSISIAELGRELGQPGAKILLHPGETYVDNQKLDEPYTNEDPSRDLAPTKIGPDELFMMGDNRNHSKDSTYWGALKRYRVIGRAAAVFFPPLRMGTIR